MRRFLEQYGRSDVLILKAQKLTEAQLAEYAKAATDFTHVHKFIFSAKSTPRELETHVYPQLCAQIAFVELLDLHANKIRGGFFKSCAACATLMQRYSFIQAWCKVSYAPVCENSLCPVHAMLHALRLEANKTLKIIKLGSNPLGNAGVFQILCAIVDSLPNAIAVFDASNCGVTDDAAVAINALLRKIPPNKPFFIKLNGNRLGATGTQKVAQSLPGNISLTVPRNRPRPTKRKKER